jgi:hypothetical protein
MQDFREGKLLAQKLNHSNIIKKYPRRDISVFTLTLPFAT